MVLCLQVSVSSTGEDGKEVARMVLDHEGNPEWKCYSCDFRYVLYVSYRYVIKDITIDINSLYPKVGKKFSQVNTQQRQRARNCDSTCAVGSHPQWSCVPSACCPPL